MTSVIVPYFFLLRIFSAGYRYYFVIVLNGPKVPARDEIRSKIATVEGRLHLPIYGPKEGCWINFWLDVIAVLLVVNLQTNR